MVSTASLHLSTRQETRDADLMTRDLRDAVPAVKLMHDARQTFFCHCGSDELGDLGFVKLLPFHRANERMLLQHRLPISCK